VVISFRTNPIAGRSERGHGAGCVGLVCSHGGHLTELLQLVPFLQGFRLFLITYSSTRSIPISETYFVRNIGRNPILMFFSFVKIFVILLRRRPLALISTGAEIAIPAFLVARVIGARTIFIESWCRVEHPSMTGRVMYPLCDHFFVQWADLLLKYGPKARYVGAIF